MFIYRSNAVAVLEVEIPRLSIWPWLCDAEHAFLYLKLQPKVTYISENTSVLQQSSLYHVILNVFVQKRKRFKLA